MAPPLTGNTEGHRNTLLEPHESEMLKSDGGTYEEGKERQEATPSTADEVC